jgi:hypothetical protein
MRKSGVVRMRELQAGLAGAGPGVSHDDVSACARSISSAPCQKAVGPTVIGHIGGAR